MIKKLVTLLFLAPLLLFTSCGGEKADEGMLEEDNSKPLVEESKFNAQNVFNSLPDRKIVLKLIEANQIQYNPDLLNDPQLVNKYSIEVYKAVNLGIYGSDLTIASSFDQTQESMLFLKCVNILAGSLGVNSAFDQKLFDRIGANDNNKDSIVEIVTGAFKKVDEILKYNNRPATSAVILSGCWIEGLYVSCKMAETVEEESIIKTILGQKEALKNLIVMLEAVNLEEKALFILNDLKSVYAAFEAVGEKTKYDKKAITGITQKITDLRNKITTASA